MHPATGPGSASALAVLLSLALAGLPPGASAEVAAPRGELDVRFDATGVALRPVDGGWSWGLQLVAVGRPDLRDDALSAVSAVAPEPEPDADGRTLFVREGLVEWFRQESRGLKHAFEVDAPPAGPRGTVALDLALRGDLHPRLSEDGRAVDFYPRGGALAALRYAELAVFDARGRELPSRLEGVPQGIRIAFDDTDAVYPVHVDPLATTASWTGQANEANAHYGKSVATAGDVNGDGYSDVLIGAPSAHPAYSYEGRVVLHLGSPSGLQPSPAWSTTGAQADANYGWSVAPAGDVNGDGYADVVIGAYAAWTGEYQEGKAYVYHGSPMGLSPSPDWQAEGGAVFAAFGWSVSTAGDVNGDGYDDVAIAVPGAPNGGRVQVFHGSPAGLSASADWTYDASKPGSQLGSAVAAAGDVNGDGYADLIVGDDSWDGDLFNEGAARIFFGSAGGLGATPGWHVEGNQSGSGFGFSVAGAGDLDGDGYADVLVGAPDFDDGHVNQGAVSVFLGGASGPATAPVRVYRIPQAGARVGASVATAGDVDGDGYADLVLGGDRYDFQSADSGIAVIYPGAPGGPSGNLLAVRYGMQLGGLLGGSVATAGDVNGDGFSDVIVGAWLEESGQIDEGMAAVYHGSAAGTSIAPSWIDYGEGDAAGLGRSVASAGDVDGDGYSDALVGVDGSHRAFLYRGSAQGLSLEPSWTAGPEILGDAAQGVAVAGAGDVNGDGYDDVLLGVWAYQGTVLPAGAAFLFHGSAGGLETEPAWIEEFPHIGSYFGWAVAGAGDVNGDGYADVLVGARTRSAGVYEGGGAYVYLGSATGLAAGPVWAFEPATPGAWAGSSVAGIGDVDGDGYADIAVGAPNHDFGVGDGRVYVFHGSPSGPRATPDWIGSSGSSSVPAAFGSAVAGAGDVNGDGYSDLIVGDRSYRNGLTEEGRAQVFHGSSAGLAVVPAWTYLGIQAAGQLGSSVTSAGDVNGDGYSDVAVGEPFHNGFLAAGGGRVHVFLGSAAGLFTAPFITPPGGVPSLFLGTSLAGAGDVDGDGYADLLAGGPGSALDPNREGQAHLYPGNEGNARDRTLRQARGDGTTPIALYGKSDAEDAFRLRVRAATAAGRGRVRLEWQVAPVEAALAAAPVGSSTWRDTGLPGPSGSVATINQPIDGLEEGTFYRWRVRVAGSPYFPRTPWRSLPGGSPTGTKLRTAGCVDRDGDGWGGASDPACEGFAADCDDALDEHWAVPGTVRNLRFESPTVLRWDLPGAPGSTSSALRYDVLRSGVAAGFLLADCIEFGDGPDPATIDTEQPLAGRVFYYLVRGRNACPGGVGSLGSDSGGAEREGASCF